MFSKAFAKLYCLLLFTAIANYPYASSLTDNQIAILLIEQSKANYSGQCPCPYSLRKNGKPCGGLSAYSKPGGKLPLCFRSDVTAGMIDGWRDGRGGR
ncbi:MAG: hypothetical protein V4732_04410 [Pseudomonadota bacterium]